MSDEVIQGKFCSVLRDASGAEQKTESQFQGLLQPCQRGYQITYEEEAEGDITRVKVLLLPDEVQISRSGPISVSMRFVQGEETESLYQTLYGSLPAVFITSRAAWSFDSTKGVLHLAYDVSLAGSPVTQAEIHMQFMRGNPHVS